MPPKPGMPSLFSLIMRSMWSFTCPKCLNCGNLLSAKLPEGLYMRNSSVLVYPCFNMATLLSCWLLHWLLIIIVDHTNVPSVCRGHNMMNVPRSGSTKNYWCLNHRAVQLYCYFTSAKGRRLYFHHWGCSVSLFVSRITEKRMNGFLHLAWPLHASQIRLVEDLHSRSASCFYYYYYRYQDFYHCHCHMISSSSP